MWQKITEIGRTAVRLSPRGPTPPEGGFGIRRFPGGREGAAPSLSDFGDFLPQKCVVRVEPPSAGAGPARRARQAGPVPRKAPSLLTGGASLGGSAHVNSGLAEKSPRLCQARIDTNLCFLILETGLLWPGFRKIPARPTGGASCGAGGALPVGPIRPISILVWQRNRTEVARIASCA